MTLKADSKAIGTSSSGEYNLRAFWRLATFLSALLVIAALDVDIRAQTDKSAPLGLAPGAPAGSYPLSNFDNVNLFNGSLNFRLPLLTIGGRGEAANTIYLPIEQHWGVENIEEPGVSVTSYPRFNWWHGDKVKYSPGFIWPFRTVDGLELNPPFKTTQFTFTDADETQYEFRDALTDGQPIRGGICRGDIFKTRDGSALSFISDNQLCDQIGGLESNGRLMFPNGTTYRIDDGNVSYIRDRNGNAIKFNYEPLPGNPTRRRLASITDSLERQVTFSYGSSSDTIAFAGFDGNIREIQIEYGNLDQALIEEQTIQTLHELFPEINWGFPNDLHNPRVTSAVTLPNGQQYTFRYNSYGELAEVKLPTGGVMRYAYAPGRANASPSGVLTGSYNIYRRLRLKDVYTTERGLEQRTYFGIEYDDATNPANTIIGVEHISPNPNDANDPGTTLYFDTHYFYGKASSNLTQPGTSAVWTTGKEYKTEIYNTVGGMLHRTEHTWSQNAPPPWWTQSAASAPINEPRIKVTTTTLENGLKSRQVIDYDIVNNRFNNRTDVVHYDWNPQNNGPVIRYEHTDYVNSPPYTSDTVHLLRLPVNEEIRDVQGVLHSKTTYGYDEGALTNRSNMTGRLPGEPFGASYLTRGNPTSVNRFLDTTGGYLVTARSYDIAGNVVRERNPRSFFTDFDYTDRFGSPDGQARSNTPPAALGGLQTFALVTNITNTLGHTTFHQYDYFSGKVVDMEDQNGVVTSAFYDDPLDRSTGVIRANRTDLHNTTTFEYDDVNLIVTARKDKDNFGDGKIRTATLFDSLGRDKQSRQYEDGGGYIAVRRSYDALGRVDAVSNPFPAGTTPVYTATSYDELSRPKLITAAFNAQTKIIYLGNETTVTDPAGKIRSSKTDALGRITSVVEDPNAPGHTGLNYITQYGYDVLGNLTSVSQGQQTRIFGYDTLSRLKSTQNPETEGEMRYDYDENGNLRHRISPSNITTTYDYDDIDRIITRSYSDGTPQVTYTYDDPAVQLSTGRLTKVESSVSTTRIPLYDALGRITQSTQTTDGQTYSMSYGYNLADLLKSETYPSGRVVTTGYDDASRPILVRDIARTFASDISYAPHGAVKDLKLGNGLWEFVEHNERMQPHYMRLGTSPGAYDIYQLENGFGGSINNGNVNVQVLTIGSTVITTNYGYDGVNRLKDAGEGSGGFQTWSQHYDYDRYGNRVVLSGLRYDPQQTPSSLAAYDALTNRFKTSFDPDILYDRSGNLRRDALARSFTYDGENHQTSAPGATYSYDGEGHRVKKVVNGTPTVFVYDAFGKLMAEYTSGFASTGTVRFVTQDQIGNTRIVTNQSAAVVSRIDYLPFGEEITPDVGPRASMVGYGSPAGATQKFTGKERDSETGLDYFGARYLSGAQGRFTSPDAPFADQNPADPQSWNLYAYVRNNALRYIDDSGGTTRPAQSKFINDALASDPTLRRVILASNNFSPEGFEDAFKSGGLSDLDSGAGNILRGLAGEATVLDDINGSGSVVSRLMGLFAPQPGSAFPSPTNLPDVHPDVAVSLGFGMIPMNLPNVANAAGGLSSVAIRPTVTANYLEVKSGLSASSIRTGVRQAVATAAAIAKAGMAGTAISTLVVDAGAWFSLSAGERAGLVSTAKAGGANIQVQSGLANAARERARQLVEEARKRQPQK